MACHARWSELALTLVALVVTASCSDAREPGLAVARGSERADAEAAGSLTAPPGTGGVMLPPSDPEKAIRDQYAEARRQDTDVAYRLFIDRYPDHPLAQKAARRLAQIQDHPGDR